MQVYGQLVDIHAREIFPARITIYKGKIKKIERILTAPDIYILPGLIDAHVHIESSMLTPQAFAAAAVSHGTIGVVSDPHEIGNVLGIDGVNFMIEDSKKVPVRFWFGAPSCVPATSFETNGETIDSKAINKLLSNKEIKYLAEMMNFPGVIYNDAEVWKKIKIAKKYKKPIDGHAPGLTGEMLRNYVSAGISTDHECSTMGEALEKISLGMKILIREGSAARNLEALKELFRSNPDMIMLCSDDLHPEMLVKRHINKLIAGLVSTGYDLYDVIRSCTINPVSHYGLESGLLYQGQFADFILVDDLKKMNVLETWINGQKVYDRGRVFFKHLKTKPINKFNCSALKTEDIQIKRIAVKMRVIEAFDGELFTKENVIECGSKDNVESDITNDILKIIVKDRYHDAPPAVGYIKGFGLKKGAFASSVAHDSHNIICIGTNDNDIIKAVNEIVRTRGGLAVSSNGHINSLQLNIAGIMSVRSCNEIASDYEALSEIVRSLGCSMSAPFMTLSFMSLLVIPELKLSDRGLFDGKQFCLVPLFME